MIADTLAQASDAPAAIEAAPREAPGDAVDKGKRPRPGRHWLLGSIAVMVAAFALFLARPLLFPLLLAVLLSLLLAPAVKGLARVHIPEPAGAGLVLGLVLAAAAGVAAHLYEPAENWIHAAPREMRQLENKLRSLKKPVAAMRVATDKLSALAAVEGEKRPREVVVERRDLLGVLADTQPVLVSSLSTLILLYFLLASGDLFFRKLIRLVPTLHNKRRAIEITQNIRSEIGRYFAIIAAINIGLGCATAFAMSVLGLPNPALWGALVAGLNFIPYVGPFIGLLILTAVALLSFDSLQQAAAVPAAFALIAFVEGQLLQPIVIGRRLAMHPIVIFIWVLAWGWLWGIGGAFLAVPLLVCVKICAEHIPGGKPLAEFIGRE